MPKTSPPPPPEQAFAEFAAGWFEAFSAEWRPKTHADYSWQLRCHLLPFFGEHRLGEITIAEVDRYRHLKAREGSLSATSINKTITRLAQILEVALEYGLIERNPARGRRRRLRAARPAAVWLDRAEQIEALLEAASQLDAYAERHGGRDQRGGLAYRHALLATLLFGGLRIGELLRLRWRDVDLAGNRVAIGEAKTAAGVRQVDLLPVLRQQIEAHRARAANPAPTAFVFESARGGALIDGNIRRRVFAPAVARANELLLRQSQAPLPEGLTLHKLRHTFASILVAIGVDPGVVMEQLGHRDPGFTLRVYRHGMRRDEESVARLAYLVGIPAAPRWHAEA
jgi:integrase